MKDLLVVGLLASVSTAAILGSHPIRKPKPHGKPDVSRARRFTDFLAARNHERDAIAKREAGYEYGTTGYYDSYPRGTTDNPYYRNSDRDIEGSGYDYYNTNTPDYRDYPETSTYNPYYHNRDREEYHPTTGGYPYDKSYTNTPGYRSDDNPHGYVTGGDDSYPRGTTGNPYYHNSDRDIEGSGYDYYRTNTPDYRDYPEGTTYNPYDHNRDREEYLTNGGYPYDKPYYYKNTPGYRSDANPHGYVTGGYEEEGRTTDYSDLEGSGYEYYRTSTVGYEDWAREHYGTTGGYPYDNSNRDFEGSGDFRQPPTAADTVGYPDYYTSTYSPYYQKKKRAAETDEEKI